MIDKRVQKTEDGRQLLEKSGQTVTPNQQFGGYLVYSLREGDGSELGGKASLDEGHGFSRAAQSRSQ